MLNIERSYHNRVIYSEYKLNDELAVSMKDYIKYDKKAIWIFSLKTEEQYRNKGFATEALKQEISFIRKMFRKDIKLSCKKDNVIALKLYLKLGFKVIKENEDIFDLIKRFEE